MAYAVLPACTPHTDERDKTQAELMHTELAELLGTELQTLKRQCWSTLARLICCELKIRHTAASVVQPNMQIPG